jgi:hypothetical protein
MKAHEKSANAVARQLKMVEEGWKRVQSDVAAPSCIMDLKKSFLTSAKRASNSNQKVPSPA